ncbi:MAG: head-tail adaptor protein [Alphaproteobacteria bacterium]|nr:head-tail adaptor protein [Alphaproteobacteria bacterium]
MFGIGTYRQRLYLQQENAVADTGGGNALGWTTLRIVWASVEPLRGSENIQAGGLTGNTVYRIRMRYDADITSAMRLVLGTRALNIRSILNVQQRSRVLEIIAQEGVAT